MSTAVDLQVSASQIATEWLTRFSAFLQGTADASDVFHANPWWRDILTFHWDYRAFLGGERISEQARHAASAQPRNFVPSSTIETRFATPDQSRILAFFEFETDNATNTGVAHLALDESGRWAAAGVLTAMESLKGHEEINGHRRPLGRTPGDQPNWLEQRKIDQDFADRDPEVLIVGSGQAGLATAARLGQLQVPTLIVEKNARVGDNWRKRYRSLVLHDPVWFDHLPYLPFPSTWPVFTPKDKMGDWLEAYASILELNVWTSSTITHTSYDEATKRWTVVINRDGTERTVHPAHVVIATGLSGTTPYVPEVRGADDFTGELKHSTEFASGDAYAGKRVLVVGAATSAHDLAQALHEQGAQVTMLQRSATYVIGMTTMTDAMGFYKEGGGPTETADLIAMSVPMAVNVANMQQRTRDAAEVDREILDGLRKAGFNITMGIEDAGHSLLFFEKAGGYYIDVGCSQLIIDGHIAMKSGVEIDHLTTDSVVFTDGESQQFDAIYLATGYHGVAETARRIVGDDIVANCGPIWGLDDEGELQGVWRPTGQPGLWFAGGNLGLVRHASKYLALQLKADLEGLRARS